MGSPWQRGKTRGRRTSRAACAGVLAPAHHKALCRPGTDLQRVQSIVDGCVCARSLLHSGLSAVQGRCTTVQECHLLHESACAPGMLILFGPSPLTHNAVGRT